MDRVPVSGVLFDWRGTLVCDPEEDVWLQAAADRLGRELDEVRIEALLGSLETAAHQADLAQRLARADCSAADHRAANLDLFRAVGMDEDFAVQLYELDFDSAFHPFFPDAAAVLSALSQRGVAIAVVSDIHFDLRPEFRAADLDHFIDAYVLSFEHNVQKPDPAMFELALDALGLHSHDVLMVGDNARRDGGATEVGIRTLVLPPLRECVPRGLDAVMRLLD